MSITTNQCRLCHAHGAHVTYELREMMFGTSEEFSYFRCGNCGCLQISAIPANLASYYPSGYTAYYSPQRRHGRLNSMKALLKRERYRTALFGTRQRLNRLLTRFISEPAILSARPNDVSSVTSIVRDARIKGFGSPVLDVGCGSYSYWLAALEDLGFTNLQGIDPLIPKETGHGRVTIYRQHLSDVRGKFALITLHHSLEHIPDQREIVAEISRHLMPGGVCLIRIPIIPSQVWEEYGVNWVELDAPRHLYLHSVDSLRLVARAAGLEIFDIQYDTTAFEFYGSEMYRRGIKLSDENSPWVNAKSTLFTGEEMDEFKARARQVNADKCAGRAAFFLRKRVEN